MLLTAEKLSNGHGGIEVVCMDLKAHQMNQSKNLQLVMEKVMVDLDVMD